MIAHDSMSASELVQSVQNNNQHSQAKQVNPLESHPTKESAHFGNTQPNMEMFDGISHHNQAYHSRMLSESQNSIPMPLSNPDNQHRSSSNDPHRV